MFPMEKNAPVTVPSTPLLTVATECSRVLDLWTTWDVLLLTLVLPMERSAPSIAPTPLLPSVAKV